MSTTRWERISDTVEVLIEKTPSTGIEKEVGKITSSPKGYVPSYEDTILGTYPFVLREDAKSVLLFHSLKVSIRKLALAWNATASEENQVEILDD